MTKQQIREKSAKLRSTGWGTRKGRWFLKRPKPAKECRDQMGTDKQVQMHTENCGGLSLIEACSIEGI